MNLSQFWQRAHGRYMRTVAGLMYRRTLEMHNSVPYISFTFDDFPRSALHTGGRILGQFGLRGTYYVSFGLMGTVAPTGTIFLREDIGELLAEGHELGCHTFDHYDCWKTSPEVFEDSIIRNRRALGDVAPSAVFRAFSYPITTPRPRSKYRAGKLFSCCRCGCTSFNQGVVDLNLLDAFFLEKSRDDPGRVKEVIDLNNRARGWLIFATHDVSESHSPYGCTPSFFEDIVKYSKDSGAKILPVSEALDAIRKEGYGEKSS